MVEELKSERVEKPDGNDAGRSTLGKNGGGEQTRAAGVEGRIDTGYLTRDGLHQVFRIKAFSLGPNSSMIVL